MGRAGAGKWLWAPDAALTAAGIALLVALGLAAVLMAVLLWRAVNRPARPGLPCRWRRDGGGRWLCRTCGQTGFSATDGAPVTCVRDLGPRPL